MMLTVKQVAKELAMSVASVYQLIKSRKLPSHQFGVGSGGIRVSESDLAAFIDDRRTEKRPPVERGSLKRKPLSAFKHLRLEDSPDSVEPPDGRDIVTDADKRAPASTDQNDQVKSPRSSDQRRM